MLSECRTPDAPTRTNLLQNAAVVALPLKKSFEFQLTLANCHRARVEVADALAVESRVASTDGRDHRGRRMSRSERWRSASSRRASNSSNAIERRCVATVRSKHQQWLRAGSTARRDHAQ